MRRCLKKQRQRCLCAAAKDLPYNAFLVAELWSPQFQDDHDHRGRYSQQISSRLGEHGAVDAPDQGEDQHSGDQENHLPGKGQENTFARFSDCRKGIGRDGLDEKQSHHKQVSAEVQTSELDVQIISFSEQSKDLRREQLENDKADYGDDKSIEQYTYITFRHPVIVFRPVIETGNGLVALAQADDHCGKDRSDLHGDAGGGDGDFRTVFTESSIMIQGIIDQDLSNHQCQLVQHRCQSQLKIPSEVFRSGNQMFPLQPDRPASGQEEQTQEAADNLADDRSQGRAFHAPAKAQDEPGVQTDVDETAGEIAGHGKIWPSVRAQKMAGAAAQNGKGEPQGNDLCIVPGIGKHRIRSTKKPQHGIHQTLGDQCQYNAAQKQRRYGVAEIIGRCLAVSFALAEVKGSRSADTETKPQCQTGIDQRKGDIGSCVAQLANHVADKKLIYNVITCNDQHGDDAGHGKPENQFADLF